MLRVGRAAGGAAGAVGVRDLARLLRAERRREHVGGGGPELALGHPLALDTRRHRLRAPPCVAAAEPLGGREQSDRARPAHLPIVTTAQACLLADMTSEPLDL